MKLADGGMRIREWESVIFTGTEYKTGYGKFIYLGLGGYGVYTHVKHLCNVVNQCDRSVTLGQNQIVGEAELPLVVLGENHLFCLQLVAFLVLWQSHSNACLAVLLPSPFPSVKKKLLSAFYLKVDM